MKDSAEAKWWKPTAKINQTIQLWSICFIAIFEVCRLASHGRHWETFKIEAFTVCHCRLIDFLIQKVCTTWFKFQKVCIKSKYKWKTLWIEIFFRHYITNEMWIMNNNLLYVRTNCDWSFGNDKKKAKKWTSQSKADALASCLVYFSEKYHQNNKFRSLNHIFVPLYSAKYVRVTYVSSIHIVKLKFLFMLKLLVSIE